MCKTLAQVCARRMAHLSPAQPTISFCFDDFPRSAWLAGGEILRHYGAAGTYYASLGLMNRTAATGGIFTAQDLEQLLAAGHEIGCHTFEHSNSWKTTAREFAASIERNQAALEMLFPGVRMRSFSYPYTVPAPLNKAIAGAQFACCRDHGQRNNVGNVDLNLLNSHFLEMKLGGPDAALRAIAENHQQCGWLIFSTHDLSAQPTQWGWTPEWFEQVVRRAAESGARLLSVGNALEMILAESARHSATHVSLSE
jgi:peptidoglycan/xylan/chitin deacetylase (PgdA/CDA1 family)